MSVEDLTLIERAKGINLEKLVLGSPASYTFSFTLYFNNNEASLSDTISGSGGTYSTLVSICAGSGIDVSKVDAIAISSSGTVYYSEGRDSITGVVTPLTVNDQSITAESIKFPSCEISGASRYSPTIATATADGAMATGACRLMSVTGNASAAFSFILYDNTAASGTNILGTVNCIAGENKIDIPAGGIAIANGVFLDITGTGTVRITTVAL
jgi:hypothetical protein